VKQTTLAQMGYADDYAGWEVCTNHDGKTWIALFANELKLIPRKLLNCPSRIVTGNENDSYTGYGIVSPAEFIDNQTLKDRYGAIGKHGYNGSNYFSYLNTRKMKLPGKLCFIADTFYNNPSNVKYTYPISLPSHNLLKWPCT